MHIAWDSILVVFVVSFAAAVAVVVLLSFALVALSARDRAGAGATSARIGVGGNTFIAGICLTAAAAIVLYGLHLIVAA
jgi:heme/copper-type cytochrome/quinol oxidase subunit 2